MVFPEAETNPSKVRIKQGEPKKLAWLCNNSFLVVNATRQDLFRDAERSEKKTWCHKHIIVLSANKSWVRALNNFAHFNLQYGFCDNRRNSLPAHWLVFVVNKQTETRIYIYAMRQQIRVNKLTICYRKKTNWVQFFKSLPRYWQWSCYYIGSAATVIMVWRNSWSITGQTHEKLMSSSFSRWISLFAALNFLKT